jgi:hypothetical protein
MMHQDQFYQIDLGEIFVKSRCMQHELVIANFFKDCLVNLGYQSRDVAGRIWKRGSKQVVVCLADDFSVCSPFLAHGPLQWFDSNTVVITDNHITVDTPYTVCQLPVSYFGIFSYIPDILTYGPMRRFNFSINRLDTQRLLIFLEFAKQCWSNGRTLDQDFINFNTWDAGGCNETLENLQTNLNKYWDPLRTDFSDFTEIFDGVSDLVPIRNHELSIELANSMSWLVPVVETYSGNTNMAFSEKLFRALQSPVPWTVYSATGAIRYLQSLGFDTLDDLIDHDYNNVVQESPWGFNKINCFVQASLQNVERLKHLDLTMLQARCLRAAQHNQTLLAQMRVQWPRDFADWLPVAIDKLL